MGGLVVFPTDTVYGIAADYNNVQAMKRLREIKKRSTGKPFSVLISQQELIVNYTPTNDQKIFKLIDAYWPGPLTIVVPSRQEGETIGVRMPDNIIALRLVREAQATCAAPSANLEGETPPLTCADALKQMDGLVEAAIDGGQSPVGVSSTVVDMTRSTPVVLRTGSISEENIKKTLSRKHILFVCTGNSCRSVMAEYLLKDRLGHRDDVVVSSAGTGVFVRSSASQETVVVLKERGIDASRHTSQGVSSILLKKADIIFVMTQAHRNQVLARVPEVEKRVYLLKEFANIPSGLQPDLDIPDPIGKSHLEYKECLTVINEAVHKIVELL